MSLLIAAGLQLGGGLISGLAADKKERARVRAHNAAAIKQNTMNLAATEQAARALDLQRQSMGVQVRKSLEIARRTADQTTGSINASAGAGGVMGMSIDAVAADVERDFEERRFELEHQREGALVDMQLQREAMFAQYKANMTQLTTRQRGLIGAGIVGGVMNMATSYAASMLSSGALGGANPAPTIPAPSIATP